MSRTNVIAAVLGVAAAVATDRVGRRLPQRPAWAAGLVGAAAIYPAARRGGWGDRREQAVLAAAGVVTAAGLALPEQRGRRVIAAGWAAHALFDAAFTPHDASRIPTWYPAMCAGYDFAAAAALLRG